MGFCRDSKKNSLEINMDYNISCVFLLGFYRGLLKKNWDSIGITDDHKKRSWDSKGILEGFQNILRGILWDSMGFCFFFGNICSSFFYARDI